MKRTPLKRKTPMKRVSDKRRKLMREVGPERKARKAEVGCCMLCRRALPPSELDADEIARGPAREACLKEPSLILILCRCCHDMSQNWQPGKRIAIGIMFEVDVRCAKYNELRGTGPNHVTRYHVLNYLDYAKDLK